MNRQSPTRPKQPTSRTKQASVGGILLTLLVAAITWWNGSGVKPTGQPNVASNTPQATLAIVLQNAPVTTALTKKATSPASQATKPPATKAAPLATAPTKAATATPKVAKPTTPPRPTQLPTKTPTKVPPATPTKSQPPTPTPKRPPTTGASGLPTVLYAKLPREAQHTIDLIDQGGPFPFDRDGITFQNREGLLPRKPRGYYREYTVITPGESDRGARRVITGDRGEMFYTDDHYDSFKEVVR